MDPNLNGTGEQQPETAGSPESKVQSPKPAETSNSAPPQPVIVPKPKRKMAPRRVHSLEELDAALTLNNGNRPATSKQLGLTADQLKSRVRDNPVLRNKWNRNAMNDKAVQAVRSQNGVQALQLPTEGASSLLMQAHYQLMRQSNAIQIEIDAMKKRIERGMDAIGSDDPEVKKHAFTWSTTKQPSEEQMLREEIRQLIALQVRITADMRETIWVLQKIENSKAEKRSAVPTVSSKRLSYRPKGQPAQGPMIDFTAPVNVREVE